MKILLFETHTESLNTTQLRKLEKDLEVLYENLLNTYQLKGFCQSRILDYNSWIEEHNDF